MKAYLNLSASLPCPRGGVACFKGVTSARPIIISGWHHVRGGGCRGMLAALVAVRRHGRRGGIIAAGKSNNLQRFHQLPVAECLLAVEPCNAGCASAAAAAGVAYNESSSGAFNRIGRRIWRPARLKHYEMQALFIAGPR